MEIALAAALAACATLLALALWRLSKVSARQRRLFEHLPHTVILVFDRDLKIRYAAGQALDHTGHRPRDLKGRPLLDLVAQAQRGALRAHYEAALRGETRSFEYHSLTSNRDYWMRIVPVTDVRDRISAGVSVALDTTDRGQADREVASRAADVEAVTAATRALARSVDPSNARAAVCEGARQVAGAPVAALFEPGAGGGRLVATAVLGADLEGVELELSGESGPALSFVRAEEIFIASSEAQADADRRFLRRTGTRAVLWHPVVRERAAIGVLAVAWREEAAGISLRLSALIDLLGAEAAVAIGRADLLGQLEHMARTDGLTGLPNRRHWEQELPRELARSLRQGTPLCVAMLDLDHFKEYNDRRGHQAGDRLLSEATTAWRGALRPYDVLARYGGEEFSVILPGCSMGDAIGLVERLRAMTPEGESCSAGIAEWDGSEAPEALVGRADSALYRAKRGGRDRAVPAAPGS